MARMLVSPRGQSMTKCLPHLQLSTRMAANQTPITLSPAQLLQRLSELVPEWMMLGIQLDIDLHELKKIESRPAGKSLNIKFIELLDLFKKQNNYTWLTVCEALKSIGNVRLARSIKVKYGEGPIQCDSPEIEQALQECVPEWSNFGLMLGLTKTEIDIIDCRDPFSNYLSDTIHYWMDKYDTVYWEVLIKAIKELGNKRLGNELEKEFVK